MPADRVPVATAGDRVAAVIVRRLAERMHGASLVVDGVSGGWKVGDGDGPSARVVVHDRRAYDALLRRGSEGLADSYAAGWWDSDDLTSVVRVLLTAIDGPLARLDALARWTSGPLSALARLRPPPPATADRRNVQAHYDLPPALFESMLDASMTYSCALFERPGVDLGEAQRAKLDLICTKLDLGPDDHLVEIGTGWGALAIHAASHYGCRVTTTTVSDAQRSVAQARVSAAGLDDRVTVLGVDYRQLDGSYDKLVSVEMIEAVDWRRHDTFFRKCQQLLRPAGVALIQSITIADRSFERAKHHDDFIRGQVFPGGCIPSVTALCQSLTRATRLQVVDLHDIGLHYAATLRCWHENFQSRFVGSALPAPGPGLGLGLGLGPGPVGGGTPALDERFRRMWALYLCYCEAAFLERHVSDVQLLIAGQDWRPGLFPGRMYPDHDLAPAPGRPASAPITT